MNGHCKRTGVEFKDKCATEVAATILKFPQDCIVQGQSTQIDAFQTNIFS